MAKPLGMAMAMAMAMGLVTASLEAGAAERRGEAPFLRYLPVIAGESWHNHGSCVVETPRGDLLVTWFHGSGERREDDVRIEGARLRRGATSWSERFDMADTDGHPDTNPCLFFDGRGRLWLVWPTILANLWESALLKYRISEAYERPGPPRWSQDGVLHVKPGAEFDAAVDAWLSVAESRMAATDMTPRMREEVVRYFGIFRERAEDKLYRRLGWMTRAHPVVLEGGRILMPLYHDGYSCSLMAWSDDHGTTWQTSGPLLGGGNIQPAIGQRKDGTLVAQMRDNGPPPARVMQSESRDFGRTWSEVVDIEVPNSGSGTDLVVLQDGRWLFVGNDTEQGRHRLAVMVSEDEGRTWTRRRYLENDAPGPLAGRYHYPSIIQARDGTLHVTYSHHLSTALPDLPKDALGKPAHSSIRHAHFNLAWLLEVDEAR